MSAPIVLFVLQTPWPPPPLVLVQIYTYTHLIAYVSILSLIKDSPVCRLLLVRLYQNLEDVRGQVLSQNPNTPTPPRSIVEPASFPLPQTVNAKHCHCH